MYVSRDIDSGGSCWHLQLNLYLWWDKKNSGHTSSWPNLTMDAHEKWFGPIKTKLYAILYCVNTGKKTHIANLHYLLTIRYVTWVAQIIGHDVPSPKLPDFLGIGHIRPKFAQISAYSFREQIPMRISGQTFCFIWPIPKKLGSCVHTAEKHILPI